MKGVVIYRSRYGATHQYARWIGNELNLPVFETNEIDADKLNSYDFIIAGTSVYIGKILIKKWLKNNLEAIWHKKIFLFVVCGTPLNKKDKLDGYVSSSVPAEILNRVDVHFLPGKLIIKELSVFDRLMIKTGAKLAEKKTGKKQSLTEYNEVKKENIAELINAVKEFASVKYTPFQQVSKSQFHF